MHLAALDPRTSFRAKVVHVESNSGASGSPSCPRDPQGRPEGLTSCAALKVWLDISYFFVEGGGQPGDQGTIAGLPVQSTVEESFTGSKEQSTSASACHIISCACEDEFTAAKELLCKALASGEPVECSIDGQRRLENSRQHTAQHILSRTAEILFDSSSSGFSISEPFCVIEFAKKLSDGQIAELERETNRVIMACLPVTTTLLPDKAALEENASMYRIGETAKYTSFPVRIVSIGDYDACPCCGTHLQNTGAAGMLKIFSHETSRGGSRVHFAAGERCFSAVQERMGILSSLAKTLTVAEKDTPRAVGGLHAELRASKRRDKELTRLLVECIAREAKEATREDGGATGSQGPDGAKRCTVKAGRHVLVVSLVGVLKVPMADALTLCCEMEKVEGPMPKDAGDRGERVRIPLIIFQNLEGDFCAVSRGSQDKLDAILRILRERNGCSGGGRGSISVTFPGKLKKKDIDALAESLAESLDQIGDPERRDEQKE